jgi:hypothetical protein
VCFGVLSQECWSFLFHLARVYKWATCVTDEERSGQPATSRTEENIAKVRQIMGENIG